MDQLSLVVKKDQMLALLGHNGAGKSTTINMLTGLLEPDAGKAICRVYNQGECQTSHVLICITCFHQEMHSSTD